MEGLREETVHGRRQADRGEALKDKTSRCTECNQNQPMKTKTAEEGIGHKCSHTLNHSIIACLVVSMNVSRECALAGSALKSALS